MVNRTRIDNPYRLAHGDRITIGSITIYFIDQQEIENRPSRTQVAQPHTCNNCGTVNTPIARFCANCGAALENAVGPRFIEGPPLAALRVPSGRGRLWPRPPSFQALTCKSNPHLKRRPATPQSSPRPA